MPTNFALLSTGGTASDSAHLSAHDASFCFDGVKNTTTSASGYYNAPAAGTNWVRRSFGTIRNINKITVTTLKDTYTDGIDPTPSTIFSLYGATDYLVEVSVNNGSTWATVGSVSGNNFVYKEFPFAPMDVTDVRVTVAGSPDGYARLVEIQALEYVAPVPAVSRWSKMNLVPTTDLLAWHALDNAASAAEVGDYSGNNRSYSASSNLAALQPSVAAINNKPALYFDGTNNPIKFTGNLTPKHIFIVAAFYESVFTTFRGLLSGISNSAGDLLVSNNSSDVFFNLGLSGFTYKKSDVEFPQSAQKAPVGGKFAVLEIVAPGGISMDGMQIGDQRNLGRKFKGWYAEDLFYGEVKNAGERKHIYKYFALKFNLWRQKSDGLNIFPFDFTRSTTLEEEDLAEVSEAEGMRGQDKIVRYLDDAPICSYNLEFSSRRSLELEATRIFCRQHRLHLPFWLTDCERNDQRKVTRTSKISATGNEYVSNDYNFSVRDF